MFSSALCCLCKSNSLSVGFFHLHVFANKQELCCEFGNVKYQVSLYIHRNLDKLTFSVMGDLYNLCKLGFKAALYLN